MRVLLTGLFGLALVFGLAFTVQAEEKVINVFNWSDYIGENTLANFTKETGIKVNYDVYDSNEIAEAKLLAGSSGYDIVVPTVAPYLARLIQAGAVQKLDKSKIPNLKNLDPELMSQVTTSDPGNQYGAIYQWGTTGIGINVDKVKARLGFIPNSYDLLFDPATVAKLQDCGVTVLDSADEVLDIVANYLGGDPNGEDKAMLKKVENQMMKVRKYYRYFHSSNYINDLANGEICVALGWSGDVFQARDRAAEAESGVTVDYIIPKEGTQIWFDALAIPAGAPHPENAHAYINHMLRPEVMAGITNYVWYANAVPASKKTTDPEILADPAIYPTDEVKSRLFAGVVKSAKFTRLEVRSWNRIRTGQ
jgi:putrescine transport system substrate-binding protein